MMINHAISSQRDNTVNAPHLTMRGGENKNLEMKKAAKNESAAVFNRSQSKDYEGKKLNPLQESIMNLREQIQKVKENEKMEDKTKNKLLKTMNKQLQQMEKQLMEESMKNQDEDHANNVKKKADHTEGVLEKGQRKEEKESQLLITAATGLERVKSMQGMAESNKGKAEAAQRELDYAVDHPYPEKRNAKKEMSKPEESSLQLHDKNIIAKKQGEINELEDIAQNLQQEIAEVRKEQQDDAKEANGIKEDDDRQGDKQ